LVCLLHFIITSPAPEESNRLLNEWPYHVHRGSSASKAAVYWLDSISGRVLLVLSSGSKAVGAWTPWQVGQVRSGQVRSLPST